MQRIRPSLQHPCVLTLAPGTDLTGHGDLLRAIESKPA